MEEEAATLISFTVPKALTELADNQNKIGDIVAYCADSYRQDDPKQVVQQTQQYTAQVLQTVALHIHTLAQHVSSLLNVQAEQLEKLDLEVRSVSERLDTAREVAGRRAVDSFSVIEPTLHRVKMRGLSEAEIPHDAKPIEPYQRQLITVDTGHGKASIVVPMNHVGAAARQTMAAHVGPGGVPVRPVSVAVQPRAARQVPTNPLAANLAAGAAAVAVASGIPDGKKRPASRAPPARPPPHRTPTAQESVDDMLAHSAATYQPHAPSRAPPQRPGVRKPVARPHTAMSGPNLAEMAAAIAKGSGLGTDAGDAPVPAAVAAPVTRGPTAVPSRPATMAPKRPAPEKPQRAPPTAAPARPATMAPKRAPPEKPQRAPPQRPKSGAPGAAAVPAFQAPSRPERAPPARPQSMAEPVPEASARGAAGQLPSRPTRQPPQRPGSMARPPSQALVVGAIAPDGHVITRAEYRQSMAMAGDDGFGFQHQLSDATFGVDGDEEFSYEDVYAALGISGPPSS